MANISIDYDSTVLKGKQIKELTNKMLVVITNLKRLENDIQQNWRGEASNQYLEECEKLIKYIMKLDLKITEFGDTIIKIANIIKQADENVASAATGMSGGGSGGGGGSW